MNVNNAIKKLLEDPDIVITGPDCSDPNKLRVYANGGRIGKIYIGNKKSGSTDLISKGYYKYSPKDGETTELEKIVSESSNALDTISKDQYIQACKEAVDNRFREKKNSRSNKENRKTNNGEKERHVQTRFVKRFMKMSGKWCVVDMEMECPRTWFIGNHFSKNTTDQPRFDIIVLNKDGIGIVELKVENDNTDNMMSHYEHMEFMLINKRGQKLFTDEMRRRIGILSEMNLIKNDLDSYPLDKIWCGFLFIGGKLNDSQELVKQFEGKKCVNELKFLYHRDFDVEKIDICNSVSFKQFISANYH